MLTINDVNDALNEIIYKTCPDPDKMSNIFFIQFKLVLSSSLHILFNRFLFIEVFPVKWKISYVSPVF
jgi:hypothetical protein